MKENKSNLFHAKEYSKGQYYKSKADRDIFELVGLLLSESFHIRTFTIFFRIANPLKNYKSLSFILFEKILVHKKTHKKS